MVTTLAWSQSSRSIFIYGDASLTIEEADQGAFKNYKIQAKNKESVTFPLYNTETNYFADRFAGNFKKYAMDQDLTDYKDKDVESIKQEGQRIFMILRLMEVNSKLDPDPLAGSLTIDGYVTVNRLRPELKENVDLQVKKWMKTLKKLGKIEVESATFVPTLIEDSILLSLEKDTKYFYMKKDFDLFDDYRKSKFVELDQQISVDTPVKNLGRDPLVSEVWNTLPILAANYPKLYKSKNKLESRLTNLQIEKLKAVEQKEIYDDKLKLDSQKAVLESFKTGIDRFSKSIKADSLELIDYEQRKRVKDSISLGLMNLQQKTDAISFFSAIGLSTTNYAQFLETVETKDSVHISILIQQYQNLKWKIVDAELSLQKQALSKQTELEGKVSDLSKATKKDLILDLKKDTLTLRREIRELNGKISTVKPTLDLVQTLFENKKEQLKALRDRGWDDLDNIRSAITHLQSNIDSNKRKRQDAMAAFDALKTKYDQFCIAYNRKFRQQIVQKIKIDTIQVEFNDGKVENLLVIGQLVTDSDHCGDLQPEGLKFTNVIPYGFTSKKELDRLSKRWIFTDGAGGEYFKMNVGELFNEYIEQLEVDRRDYSPRNQAITMKRGTHDYNPLTNKFSRKLKKEYSHEVLGGTIFTDLAGFSGDQPNGLVQTEVYKELPIITDRHIMGSKPRKAFNDLSLSVKKKRVTVNWGYLAFIRPLFVMSKIENQDKALPLSSKEVTHNNETRTIYYASTLDLRRHEMFRVGLDVNLTLFDFPELKSTIFIDYGLYWGRVKVAETVLEGETPEYGVNIFEHGPRLAWEVFTDERYGFRVGFGYNWYYARTNEFEQVGDPDMYSRTNYVEDQSEKPYSFWTTEILAFLKPNKDGKGKFFFRYRLNVKSRYWNQTWSQIQLGYAFSITKTTAPE
jgi:hypothetical protein